MRLWTVHPKYLDARGLVALWREGLLAKAVLAGKTRGYRHHPQLVRFRAQRDPQACICAYLRAVLAEATSRGYEFDATKLPSGETPVMTTAQSRPRDFGKFWSRKTANRSLSTTPGGNHE